MVALGFLLCQESFYLLFSLFFIENIICAFGLEFSFYVHDLWVCSFHGVLKLVYISFLCVLKFVIFFN